MKRTPPRNAATGLLILLFLSCASAPRFRRPEGAEKVRPPSQGRERPARAIEVGEASYYAHDFHGKKTANGEIYDMFALTAAHPSLAFNSRVRVSNLDNGKSVVVRINDRGPFAKGRIIDLSLSAAQQLGMTGPGRARVRLTLVP